jgi:hypothetical protein
MVLKGTLSAICSGGLPVKGLVLGFGFAFALACSPAYADVWDTADDNDDNFISTDTELVHGSNQTHDLGVRPGPVADQDWFRVWVPAYTSFEVVVDGIGGDVDLWEPGSILRLAGDGATVLQEAQGVSIGNATRRLAWQNTTNAPALSYIRVTSTACALACTSNDLYRISARETTVALARFNNSGTQATVLMSQNRSALAVNATYYFWSPSGTLLHTITLNGVQARALAVTSTAGLGALAGQSGSVTIAHDGQYGMWNAKAVALEPATGFSFDTPGVARPY